MLKFLASSCTGQKRKLKLPLKIVGYDRSKRIGVVVDSVKDLEDQIHKRFKLSSSAEVQLVFEDDGTEVDDEEVFMELPPQTTLMFLCPEQGWAPAVENQVDQMEKSLAALLKSNHRQQVVRDILARLEEDHRPELSDMLGHIAASMDQEIAASTRDQDPAWFKDQPSSKKTKEAAMRECAKRRVRNYYSTAVDYVKDKHKGKVPASYEDIFSNFSMELKVNDFYADYFDRLSKADQFRICDEDGWFHCEGSYNADKCSYSDHVINPYGSRTNYIIFSTWNLDHRIEKSREILPRLIQAQAKKPRGKDLNWEYFYSLLFTRINLRLVHTSCHDKTEHESEKCDPKMFYL